VPESLLQASADLGARPLQTFRRVTLPLALPGLAAGSVSHFLPLTLGDYIIPERRGAPGYFIGMMVYQQQGNGGNIPLAAAFSVVPIVLIMIYLTIARARRSVRCVIGDRWNQASLGARLRAYAVLAFMHLPALVIVLYAFTTADRTYEFPAAGTDAALVRSGLRALRHLGLRCACRWQSPPVATVFAIVLGSLTALGMVRGKFRGKESITVLLVLPSHFQASSRASRCSRPSRARTSIRASGPS
jgi:ABC-type spermidine/putrescine transport system permease subunit I